MSDLATAVRALADDPEFRRRLRAACNDPGAYVTRITRTTAGAESMTEWQDRAMMLALEPLRDLAASDTRPSDAPTEPAPGLDVRDDAPSPAAPSGQRDAGLTEAEIRSLLVCPECGQGAHSHTALSRGAGASVCSLDVMGARAAAVERIVAARVAAAVAGEGERIAQAIEASCGPQASYPRRAAIAEFASLARERGRGQA